MGSDRFSGRAFWSIQGLSPWMIGCLAITSVKIGVGTVNFLLAPLDSSARSPLFLLFVVAFGVPGTCLLLNGNRDRRAAYLGCAFLLSSSSFADPLILGIQVGLPFWEAFGRILYA